LLDQGLISYCYSCCCCCCSCWGDHFEKAEGSVVSNQIGLKFGRIVLQINTHRLTNSDFRKAVTLKMPVISCSKVLPPGEYSYIICQAHIQQRLPVPDLQYLLVVVMQSLWVHILFVKTHRRDRTCLQRQLAASRDSCKLSSPVHTDGGAGQLLGRPDIDHFTSESAAWKTRTVMSVNLLH